MLGHARESAGEELEMFCSSGQQQRAAPRSYGPHDVVGDHLVARNIIDECSIDVLDRNLGKFGSHSKLRVTWRYLVFERRRLGHRPGAHIEPYGAALHVDDRMVAILPRRGGGQAYDILRLHLPHDLFESKGGNVVAFVDDHLAVFRNEVLYFILSIQALNDRNVDAARPFRLPAADMSDRLGGQI